MNSQNRGFTLYETIFSLFIMSLVILLFPLFFSFFTQTNFEKLNQKEVELFFMHAGREIHSGKAFRIQNKHLIIERHDGNRASYEHYKHLIRRRLNNEGHEILLQHIKTVEFHVSPHIVTIRVTDEQGKKYERKFAIIGDGHEA